MQSQSQQNTDEHQQIPGTNSILSQGKRGNNQSLVQDVWQFDHDPNQSFLRTMINQKFRKYHSSQQHLAKHITDQLSNTKQQQNQYHSMVHQSGSIQTKRNNQYGLIGINQNDKKYNGVDQQGISGLSSVNQLQRVIGNNTVQNKLNHQHNNHNNKTFKGFKNNQQHNNGNFGFFEQEINTHLITPNTETNKQLFRDQDILTHKEISNYMYLKRQIKQMMQLVKMNWIQGELEDTRSKIIKLEIQNRRLKISLRSNSSMGSKFIQSKVATAQITTAMQQYGYANRLQSKSPKLINKNNSHRKLKALTPSLSKTKQNSSSNLIRIQSYIRNQTSQQTQVNLQQKIKKQKVKLKKLDNKQQQLNIKINKILQNQTIVDKKLANLNNNNNNNNGNNYDMITQSQKNIEYLKININGNMKNIQQQIDTQQTFNKNIDINYQNKIQFRNVIRNNNKKVDYKQLLIQKRNIIKQTLNRFKPCYQYMLHKLHEENIIFKQQIKFIDDKIYEAGIRIRNKNSISSQKNLDGYQKNQKQLLGANKRLLTSVQQQQNATKNKLSLQNNKNKNKRKMQVRSPSIRINPVFPSFPTIPSIPQDQSTNKQFLQSQTKQNSLRRAWSQEHNLSKYYINDNQECQAQLENFESIHNFSREQKKIDDYLLNKRNFQQRKSEKDKTNQADQITKLSKI